MLLHGLAGHAGEWEVVASRLGFQCDESADNPDTDSTDDTAKE
ncbi:hypothetical protein ACWD3Z_36775 [Streptomyces sp. NPDC002740]